jgi:hypothetical protein
MQNVNLDVSALLQEIGFKAPHLPSSFKVANWPNWLNITQDLGKKEFQEVRVGEAGFTINPRKDKLYFFVNRDGSYGFGWSFVFYHIEQEIGFHAYRSDSSKPEERLTALLFFVQFREEILKAIKEKLVKTKEENNKTAEIFMSIVLP